MEWLEWITNHTLVSQQLQNDDVGLGRGLRNCKMMMQGSRLLRNRYQLVGMLSKMAASGRQSTPHLAEYNTAVELNLGRLSERAGLWVFVNWVIDKQEGKEETVQPFFGIPLLTRTSLARSKWLINNACPCKQAATAVLSQQ